MRVCFCCSERELSLIRVSKNIFKIHKVCGHCTRVIVDGLDNRALPCSWEITHPDGYLIRVDKQYCCIRCLSSRDVKISIHLLYALYNSVLPFSLSQVPVVILYMLSSIHYGFVPEEGVRFGNL